MRGLGEQLTLTTPDHVPAATVEEAFAYMALVGLWLAGVVMLIVRKLRAA